MNKETRFLPQDWSGVQRLLLGFVVLVRISTSGENLLNNGDFEQPLGPTNWTVMFIQGGADDFDIRGRTRGGTAHSETFYGGHFRPVGQKLAHACFAQIVTNLTLDHLYTVSGQMREDWWRGKQGMANYDPIRDGHRDKYLVYIEAIGGQGSPRPDGRFSLRATNAAPIYTNADMAVYATGAWRQHSVGQTPDTNGEIEVRLHYEMLGYVEWFKCWTMSGYFDDLSLTP